MKWTNRVILLAIVVLSVAGYFLGDPSRVWAVDTVPLNGHFVGLNGWVCETSACTWTGSGYGGNGGIVVAQSTHLVSESIDVGSAAHWTGWVYFPSGTWWHPAIYLWSTNQLVGFSNVTNAGVGWVSFDIDLSGYHDQKISVGMDSAGISNEVLSEFSVSNSVNSSYYVYNGTFTGGLNLWCVACAGGSTSNEFWTGAVGHLGLGRFRRKAIRGIFGVLRFMMMGLPGLFGFSRLVLCVDLKAL